jgi:selenocysteine-specific elongation factor
MATQERILNINVGVLGHVDSGKVRGTGTHVDDDTCCCSLLSQRSLYFADAACSCTRFTQTSLVRALSTVLSTAALDKHPQSRERGITLDLGFSAFVVPAPPAVAAVADLVQFTLVDCPGHASLLRTVIGGAQIIDMMMLVVDVTKGLQAQTAECVVIG